MHEGEFPKCVIYSSVYSTCDHMSPYTLRMTSHVQVTVHRPEHSIRVPCS